MCNLNRHNEQRRRSASTQRKSTTNTLEREFRMHAHMLNTRNTGACNEQQVEAIRESGAREEVTVTVTSKIKQEANKRD